MIASAIAGSAVTLVTNPIWVVNTRMTARKFSSFSNDNDNKPLSTEDVEQGLSNRKPSSFDTLRAIIRDEGIRALFAGVLPALVLVANPILQYTIFEQLKNALETRVQRRVGPRDAFVLGAIGKLAATSITYPYITIKSRAHVAKADGASGMRGPGLLQGLRKVVQEEGWGGIYAGIGPKVTQSVMTAAFLFAFKDVLYEMIIKARRNAAKIATD